MSEQPEQNSAFNPSNGWPVLLIMLMRLYDLNLALLSAINETKAGFVQELHERGQTFAPVPKFVQFEEPED